MKEGRDSDGDDDLFSEANAWFFRLRADDVTAEEKLAFNAWIHQSPAHQKAWEDVTALSLALRRPALAAIAVHGGARKHRAMFSSFYRWLGLGMGAIALILGFFMIPDLLVAWRADYMTAIGQRRAIVLSDGTKAELDSDTALKVDITEHNRRITILKGEAYFEVFDDPRPFIVAAAAGEIRDIGTTFDVSEGELSTVSVKTGIVDVESSGQKDHWLRVTAGHAVDIEGDRLSEIRSIDFENDVGWRLGKITFRQQKLSDLVAKLNRYRKGRIIIINPQIAAERVSGTFNTDQPDAAIEALQSLLGIRSLSLTPSLVLLR